MITIMAFSQCVGPQDIKGQCWTDEESDGENESEQFLYGIQVRQRLCIFDCSNFLLLVSADITVVVHKSDCKCPRKKARLSHLSVGHGEHSVQWLQWRKCQK